MARLLICRSCGIVNRLRDYDGDPGNDWELKELVDRHLGAAADPSPDSHMSQLFRVDDEDLEKMDDESFKKALEDDLDLQISEFREDFKDQAMTCYQLHNRPQSGCSDYCHESRVLGRKAGIAPQDRSYLCYYCPVQVWVENRVNEKSGMFKGLKWN
jgi:hypothetical protein